jgi:hypothetical protein
MMLLYRLIGPFSPDGRGRKREIVESLTSTALRALGGRRRAARGLAVQTALPED